MSMDTLIRGFFAFVFAATLGGAIYYKSSRETEEKLEENEKRYIAYLPTYVLPIFLLILAITPSFTGVRMFSVFHSGYMRHAGINQIISILMWVLLAVLIIRTALVITKRRK